MLKRTLLLTILGILYLFASCNKDDGNKNELTSDCNKKIAKYIDLVNAKYIKYTNNQTVENCHEYKKAIELYIEKTKDCPGSATESYRELANTLDCN